MNDITKFHTAASKMKVAGLFAGIGGLELGFSRAGFGSALLCEIEPIAQHVLRANFPGVEVVSDVRNVQDLRGADILCAGFPCQDLSSSGNKAGITGDQSSLVDEVFRLLENNHPRWVIIENVRFMLHLNKGEAMARIVKNFERMGYNWAYRVIDSQAFGVPQRRHRVYFVASKTEDPRSVILSQNAIKKDSAESEATISDHIGFYWTEGAYAVGLNKNAIPPLKAGSTIGIPSPPAIYFPSGVVGTPEIRDAERLQGFDADWTKAAEEVARPSARWKLLGNSVTVPVSEWIANKILKPQVYDATGDRPLVGKWPNAAWSMGGSRYQSDCSDWPISLPIVKIGDFLNYPVKPLSARATNGFLSRARKGNLNFPAGFLNMLEQHSRTFI
ncbi:DNA (cytosine-5-)-methyltransferase [Pseudomonas protegens]|uniref:DNA cytosine methyltransferase n=1 Tax=Pseudomonas protegens TaxID=380021 RepID=UPI001C69C54C|nr:DNA (cytosine-5-)-methyltransferase [Pseudomonas protegens]QYN02366.1 DNA (cytosine-5-)-methyltransferase [Pseudomonas protegens]